MVSWEDHIWNLGGDRVHPVKAQESGIGIACIEQRVPSSLPILP